MTRATALTVVFAAGCLSRPPDPAESEPLSLVQSQTLQFVTAPGIYNSVSASLPSDVGRRRAVIAIVTGDATAAFSGFNISDTVARTWAAPIIVSCPPAQLALSYTIDAAPGPASVTVTISSSSAHLGLALFELAGIAGYETGTSTCAPPVSTTLMATEPITTTAHDVLISAFVDPKFGGMIKPETSWEGLDSNNTFYYVAAYEPAAPGTYTATATNSNSSQTWAGLISGFELRD